MTRNKTTALDRAMAQICRICPVCQQARRKQLSFANKFVRKVEVRLCPFCRAYERVYGKRAHEA